MKHGLLLSSWNVNSIRVREDHVARWLREAQPDLLAIQELKVEKDSFPATQFEAAGYTVEVNGQKSWNGVALISRDPLTQVELGIPELPGDPQARILSVTWRDIRVFNLYVPNGQAVGTEKYVYKLEWLRALFHHIAGRYRPQDPLIMMGDFNIAPEDRDIYDPAGFRDQVLFSGPEHDALNRLLDWGFVDLFRLHHDDPGLYSWWDYRQGAFRRNHGARIDLILATRSLARMSVSSEIDVGPRKWSRPSDHTPVTARLLRG